MTQETLAPSEGFDGSQPRYPSILPPDMADFLRDRAFGCLTHPTDQGTAFVIKAPAEEILSVRGRVPIYLRHELYEHPAAPVIRMVMTIYDRPQAPLALEMFVNVEDAQQRAEFSALATQKNLFLLFYDEALRHRLTKQVPYEGGEEIIKVVEAADGLFSRIPKDRFDFDLAKAEVLRATKL